MEKFCLSLLLVALLYLPGCRSNNETKSIFSGVAMTIPYRITLKKALTEGEIASIQAVIDQVFEETHEIYNRFNSDSEVSRFNALGKGIVFQPSQQLKALLDRAERYVMLTDGLFDPAYQTGWNQARLEGSLWYKLHPEFALDLGGIAKGTTIDQLVERISHLGYETLLVEWGGDFGMVSNQEPWRIALLGGEIVELRSGGLAASGDYQQFWKEGDKTFFHLYNPLNKSYLEQKKGHVTNVTVLAKTAEEADILATIFLLLETEEKGKNFLDLLGRDDIQVFWKSRV